MRAKNDDVDKQLTYHVVFQYLRELCFQMFTIGNKIIICNNLL
jgi:hypothetical protein